MRNEKEKFFGITHAGREWNEDAYYVDEKCGIVLDGATALNNEHYSKEASDVRWYSQRLIEILSKNINKKASIFDIVVKSNQKVIAEYNKLAKGTPILDYPCSTCALFREVGDDIEFFVLGDSEILVETVNSLCFSVEDSRNKANDGIAISKLLYFAKTEKTSLFDAIANHPEVFQGSRKNKNSEGHYFVLSNDSNAIRNGLTYTIPKKLVAKIIIVTDGFAQAFDTIKFMTQDEFIKSINSQKDAQNVYAKLHKIQLKDASGLSHPRAKLRDDATLVFSRLNDYVK